MKLTKTGLYKTKTSIPGFEIGTIFSGDAVINIDDYPHIFTPIFKFEDDTKVALGDKVFRVDSAKQIVKAIHLTPIHLEEDFELFPTAELADKELEKQREKMGMVYSQQALYSAVEHIHTVTRNVELDDMKLSEIKKKLEAINVQAKFALDVLNRNR